MAGVTEEEFCYILDDEGSKAEKDALYERLKAEDLRGAFIFDKQTKGFLFRMCRIPPPLHEPFWQNDWRILRLLLAKGGRPWVLDGHKNTPLHVAAHGFGGRHFQPQKTEIVRLLLEVSKVEVDPKNEYGETPLHRAADDYDYREDTPPETTLLLLKHGADPNSQDWLGQTPLMKAAIRGNADIAKALCEHGASLTSTDKNGKTFLHHASEGSSTSFDLSDFLEAIPTSRLDITWFETDDDDGNALMERFRQHHFDTILRLYTDRLLDHAGNRSLHRLLQNAKFGDTSVHHARVSVGPISVLYLRDIIGTVIRRKPNSVSVVNDQGMLPIHLACRFGAPVSVLVDLVGEQCLGLHIPDAAGNLPLHIACAEYASLEVVQYLTQQAPDTVSTRNGNGNLALHLACNKLGRELPVIQFLVQLFPDAIRSADQAGKTPLHVAAANVSFEVVQYLAQQAPDTVTRADGNGYLPLHLACRNEDWIRNIGFLVEQAPEALLRCDLAGKTPLHFACATGASFGVIQYLVQQVPETVRTVDATGSLPLHCACRHRGTSLRVIHFLVEQAPETVRSLEDDGFLPVHLLCSSQPSADIVVFLLDSFPDSITATTLQGWSPLHIACRERGTLELIQLLFNRNPDTVHQVDNRGWLPLHSLCTSQPSVEVVEYLRQAYEESVMVTTREGYLPFMVAALHSATQDVLFELLRANPAGPLQDVEGL